MIVESTIKVSDANETMLVYVEQSSDNTNWEKISCFPQLGTANHPNSTYTVKGGHVDCYAQVTKRYVRANIDVGGTNPSYASTTIRMRGLDAVGPA
ncbi:MAG: hypothetical protein NTZ05_04145 [Chloroflexi bacterium]|nr:hypothetical protein [Chloroflexota bacterium]